MMNLLIGENTDCPLSKMPINGKLPIRLNHLYHIIEWHAIVVFKCQIIKNRAGFVQPARLGYLHHCSVFIYAFAACVFAVVPLPLLPLLFS